MSKNPGYDQVEIDKLKQEIEAEGQNYVLVEDEMDLTDSGEYVQFQFVGKADDNEVIYDAALFTLELHYQSQLLEMAEQKVAKLHKGFLPIGERNPGYKAKPEIDELVQEFIEEIEEEDALKVSEFIEIDTDFEFGIGLEVALNVEEITPKVIEKFIKDFNSGQFKPDTNLFSFKEEA
ncbi:hypothetical protein [Jiulongibacter sp. NS-SX5]|uniref:hypothetical protein n=1 Tax=Jiulongibacter sp. NS-SX5 TaxID=3463854 RepID=UPI00405A02DC